MADLPVLIFRFFAGRRKAFFTILAAFSVSLLFLASLIHFEEDITGSISGQKKDVTGYVIKNLPVSDKLIVLLSLADSASPADPERLTEAGSILSESLEETADTTLLRSISFRAPDSTILAMMNHVMDHLPVFLDEADYRKIDSMTTPEFIRQAMQKNYRLLLSPAGMVLKKKVQRDPLGISNLGLEKLKSLQAGSQFVIRDGCIFSSDLRNLLIFLVPANPSAKTGKNDRLIELIDETISGFRSANHDVSVSYFGGTAVAVANARQIKTDVALTLIISIILIFGLIGWYFRSFKVPLLGLMPAIFGGMVALATMALFHDDVSAISLGIGSVLLGLIVDYSLYLVNHYRHSASIEQTIREMTIPVVVCSLTSVGAFLCLTMLESTVLRDLGWFASISIGSAAIFSIFILPQFFGKNLTVREPRVTFIDKLAAIRYEKSIALIIIIVAAAVVSIPFLKKVRFEENLNSLSFMTNEMKEAENELDRIGNIKLRKIFIVSVADGIEKALINKEKTTSLLERLKAGKIIVSYNDAGPMLLSDSLQNLRIARWNSYWTNERREKVTGDILREAKLAGFSNAAGELFISMLRHEFESSDSQSNSLKFSALLSDWITAGGALKLAPSVVQASPDMADRVYEEIGKMPGMVVFDRQTITAKFVESVRVDFDRLVKLTMIFVTVLLIVSFGRLGLGLMAALPMFLSWLITLGFMGLTGTKFNIFNIIISSFVFGLGVDYSILIMRGLQRKLITGQDDMASYRVSVILSSATTIFGVGVLLLARHPALHSIAMVSIIGIFCVVLISFTIPPALFEQLILKRARRGQFPVTVNIGLKTFVTWGNIVIIAVFMMIFGLFIRFLLPVPQKSKEMLFHRLFYWLTKGYIAVTFSSDRKLINHQNENFRRPAIIISNHQSLIETPAFLQLYPKILILTNGWVYRSPIFGPVARLASFFNAEQGIETIAEQLKKKVAEGYSILIFPEGHRSADHKIHRFHRGAFFLAEKLELDLLPMLVFGSGEFLGKGAFWGRPNSLRMKILPRISPNDASFGTTYQERSRRIRTYMIEAFDTFTAEEGDTHYYRRKLALNYVLKGPVLEWYFRTKLRLEDNYSHYCRLMPRDGTIMDLGCGYGFLSYMLMFTAGGRSVVGIDHDQEKIRLASNCFSTCDRIRFQASDVTKLELPQVNGYVLSDVLHYLPYDEQDRLLENCMGSLLPGGVILVREANAELGKQHKRSELTEFFSTRSGFNKVSGDEKKLCFTTAGRIRNTAERMGFSMELVNHKNLTSNNLFMIKSTKS